MLEKRPIEISFAQGLDTKTDPKRVPIGKFRMLRNRVFNKDGLMQKRNGYGRLAPLPDDTYSYLTTFNDNLTAVGPNIAAYNSGSEAWVQRGAIEPLSISTLPVLRNNLNQTACDIAIASSGTACAVYLESDGVTTTAKYVVFDSVTGQNLKAPAVIPVSSGAVTGGMRVFVLGNKFFMVFTNVITAVSHLQYVTVSISDPSIVGTNTDISADYTAFSTLSWDAAVFGNNLYVAYNTTSGGQAVKVTYITAGGTIATAVSFALSKATMMSVTIGAPDSSSPTIWVSFYRVDTTVGYSLAVDQNLNTLLAPTQTITTGTYLNLVSAGTANVLTIFGEEENAYSWTSNLKSNLVRGYTVNKTTAAVTTFTSVRGMGVGSKAVYYGDQIYYVSVYASPYQNSYFLMNGTQSLSTAPVIAARLAYENGGGYLTTGVPQLQLTDDVASCGYLFRDVITPVNKNTAPPTGSQTAGIFSQTGINLARFTFGTAALDSAEIGNNLHMSGGFLWMYDGYLPVEHNFLLFPDVDTTTTTNSAAWTQNSVVTPTGTWASGSTSIVVSSATGIAVGMSITDTSNAYIPAGTKVVAISGTTVTISAATTNAAAGDNLSIQGNMASKPDGVTTTNAYWYIFTYEWTDNQGNAHRSAPSIPTPLTTTGAVTTGDVTLHIPMLRATMKSANPVKICVYRWSVAQPVYYQVTSVSYPVLNVVGGETATIIDVYPDATILGNAILYTTGGVVENIAAPGSDTMTLFDTRLWLVDAEDRNLLWYSKQVIEATPVEMSDLLTLYVPPTTGSKQSTGPIRSLAVMDDKLIIGKKNALLYINGAGPDNTGANSQYSQPTFITATVGCTNQRSFALTPKGLMFESDKGIWLLDRNLGTSYIGAPVEDLTQGATVTSAVLVPETNQVRFTMSSGVTLMYDYFYEQWGEFTGVPAVSSCIFEDMHTYINDSGSSYQETDGVYLDGSNPVLTAWKTGPLRLGDLQGYQRVYFFYLLGTFISPHKLQVSLTYDYATSPSQTFLITPGNYSTPFGGSSSSDLSQSPFGQQAVFGGPSDLEDWRIFPERQRCMAVEVTVEEVFDASYDTAAGAGYTCSGLSAVCGFKKGYRPQPAAKTVG